MSLFNLSLHASKEDFADSHEPVNDGVKEVPNAQTIAASVKSGSADTDTNNAGEAKIIPEKPDTDDATEKQHDTVAESAEKGATKPTTPAKPAEEPAQKPTTDTIDKKAPPFVKKDEAADETAEADKPKPVDAPLEHESKEAAEDEKKKTEKVTESLEGYLTHASRFDIVGYPKADREKLQQRMNWVARRTGNATNVTISAESISVLVEAGKARVTALDKEVRQHTQRKAALEEFTDLVVQSANEPVAETSIDNLNPEAAAGLTEEEIDPLDVGITNIGQIEDTIQTLQEGQVAIEQYVQLIRSSGRISKQAAAVLQAGLEHIDRKCGLKVRATGMEGYNTSPRAAMEDADVSEKSLMDRAGEIGAKIVQWVQKLISLAEGTWDKYKTGVDATRDRLDILEAALKKLDDKTTEPVTLSNPSEFMFVGGEFVGLEIPDDVKHAFDLINRSYAEAERGIVATMLADCKHAHNVKDLTNHISLRLEQFEYHLPEREIVLPGNYVLRAVGPILSLGKAEDAPETPNSVEVSPDLTALKGSLKAVRKLLEGLNYAKTIDALRKKSSETVKVIVDTRKRLSGEMDETEFQALQTAIMDTLGKVFDVKVYFQAMGVFAKIAQAQIIVGEAIVAAHTGSKE